MLIRYSLFCLLFTLPVQAQDLSTFQRTIAGFSVFDTTGNALPLPFLGGFVVPRPQFVDMDADGDLDLFVQEATDALMFFENTGTPQTPRFEWHTDTYNDLTIGEWYRFVDVDGDGDLDLFAEEQFSQIRYYQNEGTPQAPAFTLVTTSVRDTDGQALFSDRQNLPHFIDFNCDGQLDLLIGRLEGTISYYTMSGFDATGAPHFSLVANRFQDIEIITGIGKTTTANRHGANAMATADIDQDGDVDLFWGDFFESGLLFFENTGTCNVPAFTSPILFPVNAPVETSGFNAPTFADLDGDTDLDLFMGILGGAFSTIKDLADNFYYYEHDGNLGFTLQTKRFLAGLDVGDESAPAFGDIDSDGDLDLLVGNRIDPNNTSRAELHVFENQGNGSFRQREPLPIAPTNNYMPALADLDADGDPDLLVGAWDGKMAFYRNESTPGALRFTLVANPFLDVDVGQINAPAFVDIDADGDYDLFIGESSGILNFFRNTGTSATPQFTEEATLVEGIDVGQRSTPAFFDTDADGDQDFFVGSQNGPIQLYRNTGTASLPRFEHDPTFSFTAPALSAPTFADADQDGDVDFFIGSNRGGLLAYGNLTVPTSREEPDLNPPKQVSLSNAPNPFSHATVLRYQLPHTRPVILTVYDILGRQVTRLVNGTQAQGSYTVPFDASHLGSGLYVAVLQVANHSPQSHLLIHLD